MSYPLRALPALVRGHWQLLALSALVFLLWSTPVVLPLKLLVVLFHELSHLAMTMATGGQVESLSVNFRQGGEVWTRGGSRVLILSAGYLGSLMLGAGLFVAALRSGADRIVLGLLGAVLLAVLVLYVRDPAAVLIVGATGAALLAGARWLPGAACDLALRVIGLTAMFHVPYDIFDDTLRRSAERSDARMLAEEIGGPTIFWGGLWLVVALVVIALVLRHGLGAASNLPLRRR